MNDKRLRLLILVLTLAVILFHFGYKERPDKERVRDISRNIVKSQRWLGRYPPDFTVTLLDGGTFTLADQIGKKTIVLNFFATWCDPCVGEMPELNRYYQAHRGESFILLGINAQEPEEKIRKLVADKQLEFPIALDPEGTVKQLYRAENLPTTVFIGADGRITLYEMGAVANADVTLESFNRVSRGMLAGGKGITREAYLEGLRQQHPQPASEEDKETIVLEGRARRIAERMKCVCGCDHKLLECTCSTGTGMRKKLKALKQDDPRTDEEIMREINKEFCVGSGK